MINTIQFDFNEIHSFPDFYRACSEKLDLPVYFGNNLDALWDVITAGIRLPILIKFSNISDTQQEVYRQLINLFQDAVRELDGELLFELHPKQTGGKAEQL